MSLCEELRCDYRANHAGAFHCERWVRSLTPPPEGPVQR